MNRNNLIPVFIGIFIGILSIFTLPIVFVPLLICVGGLIFGIWLIFYLESEKPMILVKIFTTGFALRLAICILLAFISYVKRGHIFFLGADDYGFSLNASRIVAAWKDTGYIPAPKSLTWMLVAGDLNYSYLLSYLYYFIGEYHFMPLFINCSLGALAIILIYLLAKKIYGYKVAIGSALFFAFWPSLVLWSTQNLKESITIFIILLVFWCTIGLRQNYSRITYWVLLLGSLALIFKIRFSLFIFLFLSTYVSLFLFSGRKRFLLGLSGFFVIYLFFVNNWFNMQTTLATRFSLDIFSILKTLQRHHQVKAVSADSAFLTDIDISKPLNFISYLPLFLLYIFFSPFPWSISNLSQFFAGLEMLLWYLLIIFALKGLLLTLRYKLKESLGLLSFFLIVSFVSFGEGNIGTLFRHRALIWPCLFIFILAGLFYYPQKDTTAYLSTDK